MTTDRTAGAGSGATSAVAAWRRERLWRTAVWALRFGYVALISVIVGVAIMAITGSRFLLGAGVVLWLCAAAVSITCVFRTQAGLLDPTTHARRRQRPRRPCGDRGLSDGFTP